MIQAGIITVPKARSMIDYNDIDPTDWLIPQYELEFMSEDEAWRAYLGSMPERLSDL
jgi:hypothetical protein